MPLYEYVCDKCGTQFEDFRSMAERETPSECPQCGGPAQLQLSACAVFSGAHSSGGASRGSSCGGGGGG